MGIWPDVLVCRSEYPVPQELKEKIALFCNVPVNHVLQNLDVEYLYEAPLAMEKENLAPEVSSRVTGGRVHGHFLTMNPSPSHLLSVIFIRSSAVFTSAVRCLISGCVFGSVLS